MIQKSLNQNKAIEHLKEWKVGALFMEAGTGKTRVACELINMVSDIDVVVWFGPIRTIIGDTGTVPKEIEKWGINYPIRFFGVESISASDRIYIEAYNIVASARKPFVVVDESIKIKNISAKRTKELMKIGKIASYKLILNGTPLSRNILDIWPQMEFLSPKILNMSFSKYKDTFCNYKIIRKSSFYYSYGREIITGYENIDYLHQLIDPYVYGCDLKLNIAQNRHEEYYTIDDNSKETYHDIKMEMLSNEFLEYRNNNIFLEMTNKMQHSYCDTEDKFRAVDNILKLVDPGKTIIYTKFIRSHEQCSKRYPSVKVLSYQKEALGLNLQQYHYTIYFDKIWDYALRIQADRRTFRIGQYSDCQYWELTGDVGLENLIDRNIRKKISMVEYFKSVSKKKLQKDL